MTIILLFEAIPILIDHHHQLHFSSAELSRRVEGDNLSHRHQLHFSTAGIFSTQRDNLSLTSALLAGSTTHCNALRNWGLDVIPRLTRRLHSHDESPPILRFPFLMTLSNENLVAPLLKDSKLFCISLERQGIERVHITSNQEGTDCAYTITHITLLSFKS